MNDVRAKAKAFYNALDFDRPINFGQEELVRADRAQSEGFYVPSVHGSDGSLDLVAELAEQIDYSSGPGAYLFTGNRGTGKTTELMRLARLLRECDCEVFYVDLSEYLNLTQRIEITDFLISVVGALSEKVRERFNEEVGNAGFFRRISSFLQSQLKIDELLLPTYPDGLQAALVQTPHVKEELQRRTRSHVHTLVRTAREFALEVVELIKKERVIEDVKVVLIVDSVDRLGGVGSSEGIREVFESAETLFASQAELLRFSGLHVVYTIPPYLQALAHGLGAHYAGGRVYALPGVHVYEGCPAPGQWPKVFEGGIDKLLAVVERRYPQYAEIFAPRQLRRLAQTSGGNFRDFFRMARLAITHASRLGLPLPDAVIEHVENAVRNDMLPIALNDREWLKRIALSHGAELPNLERRLDFARLQHGRYILQYRNGKDWYAVHPLLQGKLGLD